MSGRGNEWNGEEMAGALAGAGSLPVAITVVWEPPDMPDVRLIRAVEALLERSSLDGMTESQLDAALDYLIKRRQLAKPLST